MVSGIEAAGVALALIPLLVNQIDGYARGIEKIRLLRNCHRELLTYHTGLNTQHAILQCTLENVLDKVVNDEEAVASLIQDPQGAGWKDATLQKALLRKLGRNYEPFLGNMSSLSELLIRLSKKLELPAMETNQTSTNLHSFWKFWKILSRAVYDDLLEKIEAVNTILRTLIDQANIQEERRERHPPWTSLLRRYQNEREHVEQLFRTIAGGSSWQCHCLEHHCVHIRLQPYLTEHVDKASYPKSPSGFYFIFSNIHASSQTGAWDWREVIFKPQANGILPGSTTLAGQPVEQQIPDLCSSLQNLKPPFKQHRAIGYISDDLNPSCRYTMHPVQSMRHNSLKQSLNEALTSFSRRDRLYIAASIACAVLQYHGNWLKDRWDSSNFQLAAEALDTVYISWPLCTNSGFKTSASFSSAERRESILHSLGMCLVELSLGRPLDASSSTNNATPHGNNGLKGGKCGIADSTLRLTKEVRLESGWHYASAVDNCLSWSGVSTICRESHSFEEQMFDRIVSPLLKDIMIFDGRV
ncbi:hypothetical protein N7541_002795 [Penicillium brevicompactum]|uniref:DUF7580 domain-containing protein n=1 Tax=Penicillium brevicompactum TaxID=5074 RepID=A0A9W9RKS0_PENBR|nr:hypothetical protein N7541_002795 [Penicillium brevicompactum]